MAKIGSGRSGSRVALMTADMRLLLCISLALLGASRAAESQRIRYGPGVCGPLDPAYVKMATETGGQPYPISAEELAESPNVIGPGLFKQMMLWAFGDRGNSYAIPVDSTIQRMMVVGTFDGTGGSLTVVAPNGSTVGQGEGVEETRLNCGRVLVVHAPAAGNWEVQVTPTGRFWLTVHAQSDLSVTGAEFVERNLGPQHRIQGRPIAGRPATLRVSLASAITRPTFHLVSLDARPLQAVDLQSADEREFSGTITLPREAFRVMVNGRDDSDLPVQRIWPGLFQSEAIEIVPPAGEAVVAGTTVPVTFTIRNHGPAVRVSLVATDERGTRVAVVPAVLELDARAESVATVPLVVPADAQPSSEVGIRLTATSDARAAVGGFNSAAKKFIVVRRELAPPAGQSADPAAPARSVGQREDAGNR